MKVSQYTCTIFKVCTNMRSLCKSKKKIGSTSVDGGSGGQKSGLTLWLTGATNEKLTVEPWNKILLLDLKGEYIRMTRKQEKVDQERKKM